MNKSAYCSQHGEDILLDKVFAGQKEGYYVELGSHDGVHLSNTYYFEQRGWSGLLVEAHSGLFDALKTNRKGSTCIRAAVSEEDGEVVFYETPRGSLSTFDPAQRDYFIQRRSEVTAHSYRETKVRTARTTTLLDEARAPATIDIMSIDIEGAELAALRGLDFDKYNVRVLVVESDHKQHEAESMVRKLLTAQGYEIARTIGVNSFWVREGELARKIREVPFSGEVNHYRNVGRELDEKVVCNTVSVSFAAGENSRRRSLLTRLHQSFHKRYQRYFNRAA
ncbi:FkbM family methyltransferase [Bythopirellula goksoeyrii]|uniref:Methyltransferase FkbM domain-containing protein n=1 Tax=Bythopirellula goksoeyrii TaxID=1400387 RepID=A0A5B9QB36_9BACT|nr:FkbM family methyltransferase [Bythopirellula goksoeyrii]QEG34722.1 hypothetical protein Pr1d_20040 [Bythopirellula goksoeyrii]